MGQQCILEDWQARELLQHLYRQAGSVRRLAEKLGASKSSVHRWLKGEQIPLLYRIKLCEMLPEEELLQILKGPQLLRQYGLVDGEGRLNKPLALALLDAMMQDEAMKDEVLSYLLKYYKAELQERLGGTLPKIELHWDSGFERYLTEKKSKRITRRTLRDYKNIWDACLEGKVLGWHLLKQLEGKKMMCRDGKQHSTGWARQVFRHYIRYLYIQGKLDWDTYTRLLMVVPGRRYRSELEEKPIPDEAVIRTLKVLAEKRHDIYLVYLLMLYSAVRFEHVL